MKVNCPEDVAMLPWKGNAGSDMPLFEAVNEYVQREPDLYKRQLADVLASIIGMGEHCHIDPSYDPKMVELANMPTSFKEKRS